MLITLTFSVITMRMRTRPGRVRSLFDKHALKEIPFILWAACLFFAQLGLYLPSFFGQLYGEQFMQKDATFALIPILYSGSFFGRLVCDAAMAFSNHFSYN